MPRFAVYSLAVATLLASTAAVAEDGWSGKFALGVIATSGNSDARTLNTDVRLGHDRGIWHSRLQAQAIQASSQAADNGGRETTTERYLVSLRSALDFSEYNYFYAQAEFEKDLFGGIRERTSETVGYGRRLLKTERQVLDLELGAGARQLLPQGDTARRESEFIGQAGLGYDLKITDTSSFSQQISVEAGDSNVYSESVSALKLTVIGGIYANLSFTVKNNSEVPPDTERTDTITSISLSYEF